MRAVIAAVGFLIVLVLALVFLGGRDTSKPSTGGQLNVTQVLGGVPAAGFARALAPRRFAFPADHGPHPGFRNEWWYFTGNLESEDGRRFGYELTFFRVALSPRQLKRSSPWGADEIYMAHFALTDVAGKRFRYAQRTSRAALGLAGAGGTPLVVRLENWSARETAPKPWSVRLSAADADMEIELELRSLTPEILNGERGLSRKSATPGNASYYYSLPRMATAGTVRSGRETATVSGLSWLDREWSTSALERDQVGWDWFALQLDDGRDLMFYRLRRLDGTIDPFSSGTLVAADGTATPLVRDDVRLQAASWWTSPAGGRRYPARWRLQVPKARIDLTLTPRLPDQELLTSFRYWEGAVAVQGNAGSPGGSGYVEMTGY